MRLELEAYTLDDNANGDEYGSWNGGIQATFRINIAIVGFRVQVDKSVRYRSCRYLSDECANERREPYRQSDSDSVLVQYRC